MGLGKTLTMISLVLKSNEEKENTQDKSDSSDSDDNKKSSWLSSARPRKIRGKTLIVCPASLLSQWEGEVLNKIKRNRLSVLVHHGSKREQRARRLAEPDIVVTTYNIVSRDASAEQSPLFSIRWERVILDEAHQVRNYKTQSAQGVFRLKAKSRWALTGTPIHNKELDMFSLIKFIRCQPFDDLTVWKKWVDNRDAAGLQRLNTITKSLMLRRTKQGLQEKGELTSLTDKKFHEINITMDSKEKAVYEKLLNFSKTLFAQFLHQKAEKENALNGVPFVAKKTDDYLKQIEEVREKHPELARLYNKMKEMQDVKSHTILVLLLRLRQFCCHPSLIKTMLEKEEVSNAGIEDDDGLDIDLVDKMTRMSLAPQNVGEDDKEVEDEVTELSLKNPLFEENRIGSKLKSVLKTLEEILKAGEDKIIVVSQWVSLLNLVYCQLKEQHVKCAMLTGAVPVSERGAIVDKFNTKNRGPRVMLLSLTAGGVGLNLVGANHLLMLDPHWNPQLENQACDRIYRVGQEKQVNIYKFISSESIEENIVQLQKKKLEIAGNVLTGAKHMSKLTMEDLKSLFQIT